MLPLVLVIIMAPSDQTAGPPLRVVPLIKEDESQRLVIQCNRQQPDGQVVPWLRANFVQAERSSTLWCGQVPEGECFAELEMQSASLELAVDGRRFVYDLAAIDNVAVIRRVEVGFTVAIPPTGLVARDVRSVTTEKALGIAQELYREMRKQFDSYSMDQEVKEQLRPVIESFKALGVQRPGGSQPRRLRRPDRVIADRAATYACFVELDFSNATEKTAQFHSLSPKAIGSALEAARTRGFLTPPPRKGLAGGEMTRLGWQVLGHPKKQHLKIVHKWLADGAKALDAK